jgi:hypothetical protein
VVLHHRGAKVDLNELTCIGLVFTSAYNNVRQMLEQVLGFRQLQQFIEFRYFFKVKCKVAMGRI